MSKGVKVSVIMPSYNEEKRIEACFNRVVEALRNYGETFEIILEEDGSTDNTPEIIDMIAKKYSFVEAIHHPGRMGKGFGVRKCLERAKGEFIVLIDSDLEYPPERIPDLLSSIDGADIVVGARYMWRNITNSKTRRVRAIASDVYGFIIRTLFDFHEPVDIQSGFKAFRRRTIESISPLTSNGFEIDSEILIKGQRKGFIISCIPVTYTYKGNSKVNILLDPMKMLFSILEWKANGKFDARKGETEHNTEHMPVIDFSRKLQGSTVVTKEPAVRGEEGKGN